MSIKITLKKVYTLLEKGDNLEAINYCTSALEIYHNDPDLYSARGEALLKNGKNKEALKDFDYAAKLEPKNPFRYSSRAFLKDTMGDTDGAVKDYNQALLLDPEDATIQNNLGLLEEKLGYQKQAKKRFDIADELYQLNDFDSKPINKIENVDTRNQSNVSSRINLKIMLKVFSDKSYRKEFMAFIRNGFRIKK